MCVHCAMRWRMAAATYRQPPRAGTRKDDMRDTGDLSCHVFGGLPITRRIGSAKHLCFVVMSMMMFATTLVRMLAAQPLSAAPSAGSTQNAKTTLPSADARRQSLKCVKGLFREEFAKSPTLPKKRELARALLDEAAGSEGTVDRWVMLAEALRLAIEATAVDAARDTMDAIGSQLAIPDPAWQLKTLAQLAPKASAEAAETIAEDCLEMAKRALAVEHDQIAVKAGSAALGIAHRNPHEDLFARVTRFHQSIRDRQRLEKGLEPELRKVAESPSVLAANTAVGIALCLKASRWDEGLPMLASGDDSLLAAIATNELAESHSAKERFALGDQWRDWADAQKAPLEALAQSRAVHHCSFAVNELHGLDRVRLERRIAAIQRQPGGTGEMIFPADLPEKEATGQDSFTKGNNTAGGGKVAVRGKSFEKAVKATLKGSNATSAVEYALPTGSRRCRGKVALYRPGHAKPGEKPGDPGLFEIVVDGETIRRSPPLKKLDYTASFDVDLGAGRTLRLRMHYPGSNWCAWGTWLDPVIVK